MSEGKFTPMLSSEDHDYLTIARRVMKRANCTRSKVGAVLVAKDGQLYLGWNAAPEGEPQCLDGGCPRGLQSYEDLPQQTRFEGAGACTAIHAEERAIRSAGLQAMDACMYITRDPCHLCVEMMMQHNIRAVWI